MRAISLRVTDKRRDAFALNLQFTYEKGDSDAENLGEQADVTNYLPTANTNCRTAENNLLNLLLQKMFVWAIVQN
ncbi:MAG TPA: hypothetical protein IAC95_02555 [Candidatus Fimimonas gallinarum]|uniref:Uncharacterized protein n=1 Tax=Candidatus Fimimonas gallinarum TaxID=2840821 RepID=A0A9D1J7U5_9BACT|nr:hypothetical protein [Candidatus Fimimonas gallinarum]